MNIKGQANLAGVAIVALSFLIVIAIFGQFLSVATGTLQTNTNVFIGGGFNSGLIALLNLIPLVLVGSGLIAIAVTAYRLNN